MDTTTIEITQDQRADLAALKHGDESYKSVLQRLIDDYSSGQESLDESRVREIAREEVRDAVVMEALE